jgi:hypothetical protein
MEKRTQIWNSGGGTQSSAIAALIVMGEIEAPDLAVIVDTGREKSTTWEYLDRWVIPALKNVGVTLHRVAKEEYATVDVFGGKDKDTLLIPAYTNQSGEIGKLHTYCSGEWKRDVVRRWATKEHNVKAVDNWIGFSIDEIGRAVRTQKAVKSQGKWRTRFPLIDRGMNRGNCVALVKKIGWPPPPRSSCWMCPNQQMTEWRDVKRDPRDWPKVIEFEKMIQIRDPNAWLTSQAVPIEQADFDDVNEVLFGRDSGGCESGNCFI